MSGSALRQSGRLTYWILAEKRRMVLSMGGAADGVVAVDVAEGAGVKGDEGSAAWLSDEKQDTRKKEDGARIARRKG